MYSLQIEANPVKKRPQYFYSAVMENLKLDYCLDKCEDDFPLSFNGGSFAAGDHMVQKPPFWRAKYALGRLKQSNLI